MQSPQTPRHFLLKAVAELQTLVDRFENAGGNVEGRRSTEIQEDSSGLFPLPAALLRNDYVSPVHASMGYGIDMHASDSKPDLRTDTPCSLNRREVGFFIGIKTDSINVLHCQLNAQTIVEFRNMVRKLDATEIGWDQAEQFLV